MEKESRNSEINQTAAGFCAKVCQKVYQFVLRKTWGTHRAPIDGGAAYFSSHTWKM